MLSRSTTRVLGLLCVMYFITYVDRVNVSTAAIVFGKEFNLSNTQVGFVFSAFAYPYLIFQIIGGWVGDRFGPRRTLTICSFIWAGATVLTGLAGGLVVSKFLLNLDARQYWSNAWQALVFQDVFMGLVKPLLFGFIIATVGCFYGMTARGGTQGVGRATTQAVVAASVFIIVLNLFITQFLMNVLSYK